MSLDKIIKEWEKKQEDISNEIKNLEECFNWLKCLSKNSFLKEFTEMKEENLIEFHSTLGRRIRNDLKLWENCNLKPNLKRKDFVKWFNKLGIYHPDDMSSIIIISFHRSLNNKKLDINSQVEYYRKYWKKISPNVNKGKL